MRRTAGSSDEIQSIKINTNPSVENLTQEKEINCCKLSNAGQKVYHKILVLILLTTLLFLFLCLIEGIIRQRNINKDLKSLLEDAEEKLKQTQSLLDHGKLLLGQLEISNDTLNVDSIKGKIN